jgi:hypothetical protein
MHNKSSLSVATEVIPRVDPFKYLKPVGLPFTYLFSFSLVIFMAQPWAFDIFTVPIQVLSIWLLFAWGILFRMSLLKKRLSIFSLWQWLMILLLAGTILLRSVLDGTDMIRLAQLITGVMIALLGSLVFQTNKGRKTLLTILSAGAVVSGSFAILQSFDFGTWLWESTKYIDRGYVYGSTGLEYTPVSFGYSLVGIGMVIVGSWVVYLRDRVKVIPLSVTTAFFFSLIIIISLIVGNSRSSLFGLSLGMVFIMFGKRMSPPLRGRGTDQKFQSAVSSRAAYFVLVGYAFLFMFAGLLLYVFTMREISVFQDVRLIATWQAYLPVIWQNPWGVPGGVNLAESIDQAGMSQDISMLQRKGNMVIAPHHFLLTTGITYGVVAMLALLVLYLTALWKGYRSLLLFHRSGQMVEALWVTLLISANLAVIGHSWFHNASIAMGEMRNWLWLGLLLTVSKFPKET